MLNKVTLIGNLGKDPEMRETMSGDRVANFSIATTEKYKKNGEVVENVEWHNCAAFGKLADICGQYLIKGSMIYVEGQIRTQKWVDKTDGNTRYATQIKVERMIMLGGNKYKQETEKHDDIESQPPVDFNDIPF